MSEAGQWVTVGEAAVVSGVSERTLWRWVRDGTVESRQESRGQQRTRLVNRASLPEESGASGAVSGNGSGCPDVAGHGGACQGLTDSREESRPGAPLPACQCCKVRESETAFLRTQLDQRGTEAAELRRLLLQSQHALGIALEQRALPPAHNDVQARPAEPRRIRWWRFWGR